MSLPSLFRSKWLPVLGAAVLLGAAAPARPVQSAGRQLADAPSVGEAGLLSVAATRERVGRLTFSENAAELDGIRLIADEVWNDSAQPAHDDFETDEVSFYRTVHIESMTSEKGRALDPAAVARQQRARLGLEARVDALAPDPASAGRLVNLDGEIWTLDQIASHYAWTATPAGEIAGRAAVTLHFTPLPNLHPHTRIERVLDDTAGNLTVDDRTGQMLSGDFHSLGEVLYGAGILAHIAFNGAFTMQAAGDCWVMRQARVEVRGRALFSRLDGIQLNSYRVEPETASHE